MSEQTKTWNKYIHKVQNYETGYMGIVHHSNYIRWFEEARCDLLDYMGVGFCRSGETGDNQSDSFGGSGLSENGLLRRYCQY